MAKKSRRRRHRPSVARGFSTNRYGVPAMRPPSVLSVVLSPLRLLPSGDSRFFHPTERAFRFAAAPVRSATRLVAKGSGVQFADPRRVLVCLRRKMRREVLHAKSVAGGRVGKPRRNVWSDVSC